MVNCCSSGYMDSVSNVLNQSWMALCSVIYKGSSYKMNSVYEGFCVSLGFNSRWPRDGHVFDQYGYVLCKNRSVRAFDEFSMSSRLYPNMAKSTIFYGNVSNSIKEEIRLAMPFNKGKLPVRYLGIPLTAKKL
ncbi:hypothetical protein Tco_1553611, partial [Tanacetum coccineum]